MMKTLARNSILLTTVLAATALVGCVAPSTSTSPPGGTNAPAGTNGTYSPVPPASPSVLNNVLIGTNGIITGIAEAGLTRAALSTRGRAKSKFLSVTSRLPKDQLQEIHTRAKANRQRLAPMTCDQQMATLIKCPLLDAHGCCVCYEYRPSTCRRYHSHSSEPCKAMFDGTAEKDLRAEVVEVRYPMATLFVGLQRAFKNEGYDADAYDFSSALDEALSNPSCYKRWRHKKRAFNKDLVAEEPGGMHSARNEHP